MSEVRAAENDAPAIARITLGTGRTTFEGTGLQGTLVELSESGQLIGVAAVDGAGRWVLTMDRPLSDGDHRISTSARDPARARVAPGQDVLLSIPEGFTGTTIFSQRSPTTENVAAGSQPRTTAEPSAIANERFSEVMSSPEWQHIARSSGEPEAPVSRPAAGAATGREVSKLAPTNKDGGLAQFYDWFDRASRDYHEQVVQRLADPRPLPSEGLSRNEPSSMATKPPAMTPLPVPPAGGTSSQSPPSATPKLGLPPSEFSMLDSVRDMLDRASRDYREGVVRKLAQPEQTAVPSGPPLGPAGPATRVGDARETEALRKADEDRRTAEVRRQAEAQTKTEPPKMSELPAPIEDRAAIEARRLEVEQKMAAARRADEERRAEEARLEGLRRQAESAKRAEDEKRAAEQAKADEVKRSLEAAQREAQRSGQEAADRQKQAALDEAQRKAQDAQRMEENRRAQEAMAAAITRKAQEDAALQRIEAQRVAMAKAAEDERRRADDERKRSAAEVRPAPQLVVPSTSKASGFSTEDEYRRAMMKAARAPKASKETVPPRMVEQPAQPQAAPAGDRPASRDAAVTASRVPATGFRTQEDYRRAMIEASRAPKVDPAGLAGVAPSQPKSKATTRAEAEQAAQPMLQAERIRLAELKLERSRTEADRKRADGVRGLNATPRLNEPGQQDGKGNAGERGGATKAAPASVGTLGRTPPVPRKEQRRSAECPAAGRRVSLPGTYIVKSGDTLWNIAARFYSDGEAYQRILKANKGKVPNPDFIEPCLKLILPRR